MSEVGTKRGTSELGQDEEQVESPAKRQAGGDDDATGGTAVYSADGSARPSSPPGDPDLPPPWQEHISKRTGKPYWYNSDTKETTWVHPNASAKRSASDAPGQLAPGVAHAGTGGADEGGHQSGIIGASPQLGPTGLPLRPGKTPCAFFLKTGTCKFGEGCKFDHPPELAGTDQSTSLDRQTFGGIGTDPQPVRYGLPIRPGQQECSFFMKTGSCKFGSTCKFHHPAERQSDGGMAAMMAAGGGGGPGGGVGGLPNPMAMMGAMGGGMGGIGGLAGGMGALGGIGGIGGGIGGTSGGMGALAGGMPNPASMMALMAGGAPQPGNPMGPNTPGKTGVWETHFDDENRPYYFNTITNTSQWEAPPEILMQLMGAGGMPGAAAPPNPAAMMVGNPAAMMGGNPLAMMGAMGGDALPVRPGAPDCAFYVKTGTCKYGATCKFNHPPAAQPELHPQRPGAPDCSFYMKTGECKFGPTCKFNHPPGIQPSAGAPGLGPGLGPGMGRNGPATSALEVAAQAAQLAREMGVNESTSADSANFS